MASLTVENLEETLRLISECDTKYCVLVNEKILSGQNEMMKNLSE